MAAWGFLIFGILSLLIGVILLIVVGVWRHRSQTNTWTTGMIITLALAIILIIIGIILLIAAWITWSHIIPVVTTPVVTHVVTTPTPVVTVQPPQPIQPFPLASAEIIRRSGYEPSLVTDPLTGERTTIADFQTKCYNMDLGMLQSLYNKNNNIRLLCGEVLNVRKAELGLV